MKGKPFSCPYSEMSMEETQSNVVYVICEMEQRDDWKINLYWMIEWLKIDGHESR